MRTIVFEIPLVGTSAHQRENLSKLDQIVSAQPERLLVKLLGPGGLSPEAVLSYCDILGTLGATAEIVTVSHSNLIGADLALFLLGSPRDMRPSAWAYVFSSPVWAFEHARDDDETRGTAVVKENRGRGEAFDWMNLFWDYETCLALIGQHIELDAILDRRLDVIDLKEHLLIDAGEVDAMLLRELRPAQAAASKTRTLPKHRRRGNDHGPQRSL